MSDHYFQVPIAVPLIAFLTSVLLVIAPIVDNPKIGFIYSICSIIFALSTIRVITRSTDVTKAIRGTMFGT